MTTSIPPVGFSFSNTLVTGIPLPPYKEVIKFDKSVAKQLVIKRVKVNKKINVITMYLITIELLR